MSDIAKQRGALVATGCLAIAIGFLTLRPLRVDLDLVSNMDKVYHFIAFAALLLPTAAFFFRAVFWVFPAAVIYGGAIEIIQPFVGRGGEFSDFVADIAGMAFAVCVCFVIRRLRDNKKHETRRPN